MSYRITTRRKCYADNRMASCQPIQRLRVNIREFLCIGYFTLVPRGSHTDLRRGGRHSIVQHAAFQGANPEAHPLFFVRKQRLALESRLPRQFDEHRVHKQVAQRSKLAPRPIALNTVPRTTGYTRVGHRRAGSEYERREYVSRRDYQR